MSDAFKRWVAAAPIELQDFRRAVHVIVNAFADSQQLHDASFMKGGILMAINYDSPRFTRDIDFSTPVAFDETTAQIVCERLEDGLPGAIEALGYDLDCRLQSSLLDPSPSPMRTWVNLRMRVGYVKKGTRVHERLPQGPWSNVVDIDYTFLESVPKAEAIEMGEGRTLCVYAITTLIAEKYRALLQQESRNRVRRQDVFDIDLLLEHHGVFNETDRVQILTTLQQKAVDRNIVVTHESFAAPTLYERAKREYPTLQDEIGGILPDFDTIFKRVRTFYEGLPW